MAATASKPYVFPAINRPLEDGKLYTLDPCPNEWYGYWCSQVVEGLCAGQPNVLYDRLVTPAAAGRRGRLAGPGGVPGRPGRLPRRRAAARLRGRQAGVHRRPRPDAGAAGPGAARHGEELLDRLRRLRPAPGGDAGGAALPGLPVLQDPRGHRRAAEERAGGPGEAAGTPGGRPEAVRQALRRPAARRAAVPGGPERPAARRASSTWSRTPRRRRARTTTPT